MPARLCLYFLTATTKAPQDGHSRKKNATSSLRVLRIKSKYARISRKTGKRLWPSRNLRTNPDFPSLHSLVVCLFLNVRRKALWWLHFIGLQYTLYHRHIFHNCRSPNYLPDRFFHNLRAHEQKIAEFYGVRKRRATNFEALETWNVRSGTVPFASLSAKLLDQYRRVRTCKSTYMSFGFLVFFLLRQGEAYRAIEIDLKNRTHVSGNGKIRVISCACSYWLLRGDFSCGITVVDVWGKKGQKSLCVQKQRNGKYENCPYVPRYR